MSTPSNQPRASRPQVSVCIPAYRAEKYLEQTLHSVAAQTFADWEIVITEDGSKDGTERIVQTFASTVTQPVTYLRHDTNRGLPATRNTGIAAARGAWIAFLDSDDLWKPEHLATLLQAGNVTSADLVFSGTEAFDNDTGQVLSRSVPTDEDLRQLPLALFNGTLSVLPSSVLIRRHCFQRYGFVSTDYPHVNDTEYWLRVLRHGGKVVYGGGVTCLYRKHPGGMSRRAAELLADSALLCERYADWHAIPRSVRKHRPAALYRWAGRTLLPDDRKKAVALFQQALRLEPFNPKNVGLLAKSVLSRGK